MDARAIAASLEVEPYHLPRALARVHAALAVGASFEHAFRGWEARSLGLVIEGGGFAVSACEPRDDAVHIVARRRRSLPDFVAPGMRLLVVGLNPSGFAADAGVGFARPGNRFWPAALAAGVVTRDRDPWHALDVDRVGMTDLVKRPTTGASDLTAAEYRHGVERVEHLVAWLRPAAVCVAGLAGWRAAVDRRAKPGRQGHDLGGAPVYLMPNPSGLNAHETVETLTEHLRRALVLAEARAAP